MHLNNGTDHRHSKSCCDKSSPARRTIKAINCVAYQDVWQWNVNWKSLFQTSFIIILCCCVKYTAKYAYQNSFQRFESLVE